MSLTISARLNAIEVSWCNLRTPNDGFILITDDEPRPPFKRHQRTDIGQPPPPPPQIYTNEDNSTYKYYANNDNNNNNENVATWTYGTSNKQALYFTEPNESNGWITTDIVFTNRLLDSVNASTKCYGYWAIYVDRQSLMPILSTCIRAYPTWMNDNKDIIKRFKFRELFVLGSHDSGSFRTNFNSNRNDTLVTKYTLTQVCLSKSMQSHAAKCIVVISI